MLFRSFQSIAFCIVAGLLIINNLYSWGTIKNNWNKENTREGTRLYFEETKGKEDLYVYYAAAPGFAFYAKLFGYDYGSDAFSTQAWGYWGSNIDPQITQYQSFHYGENIRGKDLEYVKTSVSKSFSDSLPNTLWFLLSHISSDQQQFSDAFYDLGYSYQVLRWEDVLLLKLYNDIGLENEYKEIFDSHDDSALYISPGNNVSLLADNQQTVIEAVGKDPQTIISFPDIRYDANRQHLLMLDFSSQFTGSIEVFYTVDNIGYDSNHSIDAQYLANNTRILIPIPPNISIENIRLDFDNSNVKDEQDNVVVISEIKIFEIL